MSHLEKHIRTHTEERRHVCEVCGAAFILPHHLVRHNLIHTGDRPFQCEVCNKSFTRKAGLTQHQYVHNGIRPFVCDVEGCGKQFTDRTTLRRHSLTHSREKPFICKECDKTFRTKSACRKHYLRHFKDGISFKCGVCEEMFKDEETWRIHSDGHEEKRRTGAFRCGFCLRVFKCQSDLDSHVPLHESGLQHTCAQCNIKFYTEEDLLKHMTKHFPETELANDTSMASSLPPDEKGEQTVMNEQLSLHALQHHHQHPHQPHQQQQTINDSNKVLVVLQIPHSANRNLKNEQGSLQVENIQQLLGTVRIDKLVVTTDQISNSSQTIALQLSQDQQQSMQQILQTTNIVDHHNDHLSSLNDISSTTTFVELPPTQHTINSPDISNNIQQSSFVLKAHQSPPNQNKNISQYLIVPPTGPGFTPIVSNQKVSFPLVTSSCSSKITESVQETSMDTNSVFKPVVSSNLLENTDLPHPHPLELIVQKAVQGGGGKMELSGEKSDMQKNNRIDCEARMQSFQSSETTDIGIHNLNNSKEEGDQNKMRRSSENSYFQHSTDYENTLETELLSQQHPSDFSISSN